MNLAQFPRRGYVNCPTPLEKLDNFSKALGNKVNVYIKRDDLLPGTSGGNKTRKLDFSIADAIAKGADTLITCGAVQSNHCRLTLSWAVKEGMDCHLIMEQRVKDSYNYDASGNHFLFRLLGVTSIRAVEGATDMMAEMQKTAEELKAKGKKPYIIPGCASDAIGSCGYVACAQELFQQAFDMHLDIDNIVCPSGSGGTHAGMVIGAYASNSNIPVLGVTVSRPVDVQEEHIYKLANATAAHIGCGEIPREAVKCNADYYLPGYSLPNETMFEAVKLLAQTEGILLDPVYSGKAFAGLVGLIRQDYFKEGANVVFLHTGGSPALYAYKEKFYADGGI